MKRDRIIPLSFYQWIHPRIFKQTVKGYIKKDQVGSVLRQHFNIPKRMCPLIIRELEILGFIKEEDGYFKVSEADEDEVLKQLEKELLYNDLKKDRV